MQWEAALRVAPDAEAEYERVRQMLPPALTAADRQRMEHLAHDVPTLWHAAATTTEDHKAVVRTLIERVTVFAWPNAETVRVTVLWREGAETGHELLRPVRAYRDPEDYELLKCRIIAWRREGETTRRIADRLNQEGLRTPRHLQGFSETGIAS